MLNDIFYEFNFWLLKMIIEMSKKENTEIYWY